MSNFRGEATNFRGAMSNFRGEATNFRGAMSNFRGEATKTYCLRLPTPGLSDYSADGMGDGAQMEILAQHNQQYG